MKVILSFLLLVFISNAKLFSADKKDSLVCSYETKVAASPSDWETLDRYKTVCDSFSVLDRGINYIKQLISQGKDIPELHTILGLFYIDKIKKVGDIEKGFLAGSALEEFDKALMLDSLSWSALYSRGMLYLNMPPEFAQYELALKDFQKLIRIQNRADSLEDYFVLSYISLGDLYAKMGKMKEAEKIWKDGLTLFPKNTELQKRIQSVKKER